MRKPRLSRTKDKRTLPEQKYVEQGTEAYVRRYFQLNRIFTPCTYIIGGRRVVI